MKIRIRNINYQYYWINVEPNDTIENMRLKIAHRDGVKSDSFFGKDVRRQ